MFTVEISPDPYLQRPGREMRSVGQASLLAVDTQLDDEGRALDMDPPTPLGARLATPTPLQPACSAPTASAATDLGMGLAAFRERCRIKKLQPLLPRPAPRKPRKKRQPPSVIRRSSRVAGRFAPGSSIKAQQKTLMLQLGIAREGETIGDDTLQAYLDYFQKKPLTDEDLSACLALFGWVPSALPLAGDDDVLVV
jgi:hypothetical protein